MNDGRECIPQPGSVKLTSPIRTDTLQSLSDDPFSPTEGSGSVIWGSSITKGSQASHLSTPAPIFPTPLHADVILRHDFPTFRDVWERKLVEVMPFIPKDTRQFGYPIYNETRATLKRYEELLAQHGKMKTTSGNNGIRMAAGGSAASMYAPTASSNGGQQLVQHSLVELKANFEEMLRQLATMEALVPKLKAIHQEVQGLHPLFKQMMRGFDREGQHNVLEWLLQHYQVMYTYLVSQ